MKNIFQTPYSVYEIFHQQRSHIFHAKTYDKAYSTKENKSNFIKKIYHDRSYDFMIGPFQGTVYIRKHSIVLMRMFFKKQGLFSFTRYAIILELY